MNAQFKCLHNWWCMCGFMPVELETCTSGKSPSLLRCLQVWEQQILLELWYFCLSKNKQTKTKRPLTNWKMVHYEMKRSSEMIQDCWAARIQRRDNVPLPKVHKLVCGVPALLLTEPEMPHSRKTVPSQCFWDTLVPAASKWASFS